MAKPPFWHIPLLNLLSSPTQASRRVVSRSGHLCKLSDINASPPPPTSPARGLFSSLSRLISSPRQQQANPASAQKETSPSPTGPADASSAAGRAEYQPIRSIAQTLLGSVTGKESSEKSGAVVVPETSIAEDPIEEADLEALPSEKADKSNRRKDPEMPPKKRGTTKSASVQAEDKRAGEQEVEEAKDVDMAPEAEGEEEKDPAEEAGGEAGDDDDEDGDDEEGEYEVETILDHAPGQKKGKYKYLVAWKGYGPEHNTWEPEENVEHAEALVEAYWANKPKTDLTRPSQSRSRAGPSTGKSSQPPAKKARTSGRPARESTSKRNGRGANGADGSDDDEDAEEEPNYIPFESSHPDSLDKYMDVQDWEELVESVDTVERNEKGDLTAFVTMAGGEKAGLPTEVVYKRCPQKVLKFYESHLKWTGA